MRIVRITVLVLCCLAFLIGAFMFYADRHVPVPTTHEYGVSFNTPYAHELGLPWLEVYTAILDDLKVRHLRLAAHWPMVEPDQDRWKFAELDTQMQMAEERKADVVLAVGRRLPRWPECHVPEWASGLSWEEQKKALRTYLSVMVTRYKDSPALKYWQVENEPFLGVYATAECGALDPAFLDEEIALVKALDPKHPVLVTDSGNLGTWYGAYKRGDLFGTSVYVYLYNEKTGPIKTILPPETYVLKRTFMGLLYGTKESMLIELSVEPWLDASVASTTLDVQLQRMSFDRFDEILTYAAGTRFDKQYLWGAEWWYLLSKQGHPEYWDRARRLYQTSTQ
jgi:hypothetical protein